MFAGEKTGYDPQTVTSSAFKGVKQFVKHWFVAPTLLQPIRLRQQPR
jgi:hypothetical protein